MPTTRYTSFSVSRHASWRVGARSNAEDDTGEVPGPLPPSAAEADAFRRAVLGVPPNEGGPAALGTAGRFGMLPSCRI